DRALDCVRGEDGDGPFVLLRKDGSRFREGWAAAGKRHGLEREWFDDGKPKRVAYYRAGNQEGPYKEMLRDGTTFRAGPYVADKQHGSWIEGTDWGFAARGYFVRGEREGPWVGERKGTTLISVRYAKNRLHGEARVWRETGEPLAVGTFADGVGTWTSYYITGERAAVLSCAEGKLVDGTSYTTSGAVDETLRQLDKRAESTSEKWARMRFDHVCSEQPLLIYLSKAFAADHGSP